MKLKNNSGKKGTYTMIIIVHALPRKKPSLVWLDLHFFLNSAENDLFLCVSKHRYKLSQVSEHGDSSSAFFTFFVKSISENWIWGVWGVNAFLPLSVPDTAAGECLCYERRGFSVFNNV